MIYDKYAQQDSNLRPTDSRLWKFLSSVDCPFTIFFRTQVVPVQSVRLPRFSSGLGSGLPSA